MFDYHIHTKYCRHAIGDMEEYVLFAVNKLDEMGFSDHIPREFYPEEVPRELYAMSLKELNTKYFPEIHRLNEKYHDRIIVKTGLEIDYFGWKQQSVNEFIDDYSEKLDYVIGSVHILNTKGTIWSVDDHKFSHYYHQFGVDYVYDQYLDALLDLIHTGKYHILAHLDLPKKYGFRPSNTNHYFERIGYILDELKKEGMSAEISTGGLRKQIKEIYPEDRIVQMMVERDIPLVMSSDSHKPEEVAYEFKKLNTHLKNLGVTRLVKYDKGKKKSVDLD